MGMEKEGLHNALGSASDAVNKTLEVCANYKTQPNNSSPHGEASNSYPREYAAKADVKGKGPKSRNLKAGNSKQADKTLHDVKKGKGKLTKQLPRCYVCRDGSRHYLESCPIVKRIVSSKNKDGALDLLEKKILMRETAAVARPGGSSRPDEPPQGESKRMAEVSIPKKDLCGLKIIISFTSNISYVQSISICLHLSQI